jgi:hypothetical protein
LSIKAEPATDAQVGERAGCDVPADASLADAEVSCHFTNSKRSLLYTQSRGLLGALQVLIITHENDRNGHGRPEAAIRFVASRQREISNPRC